MTEKHETDATIAAGRAILLPTVVFADDLATALRMPLAAAEAELEAGAFGPRFRVGDRWAVLKESLLAHLANSAELPVGRPRALPKRGGRS